ncbi:CcmA ABC-type transport system involved in cytochrome c biogenesis, ATPase component [Rhabdaerophilaceae bacterium]
MLVCLSTVILAILDPSRALALLGGHVLAYSRCKLICSGLAVRRGPRFLFRGLDLALDPGTIMQLTGPNGSGKSTLLRLIAGFSPPDAGAIALEGRGQEGFGHYVHYFGHREGLRGALTSAENLSFLAGLLGGQPSGIHDALARLGIARLADLPVRVLSEGQRRRVALARLLVVPRQVWLLDEPLASLDSEAISIVSHMLASHAAAGGMAIVATHQPLGAMTTSLDLAGRREVAA